MRERVNALLGLASDACEDDCAALCADDAFPVAALRRAIATNIAGTATLIAEIGPVLGPNGTALFFADDRGGQKFFGCYGATKAAQIALAESWAAESAKIGPRVIIDRPAPMPTAVRARFFPGEDRAPLTDCRTEAARILTAL